MYTFIRNNRWYVMLNVFSLAIILGSIWFVFKPVALPEPATLAEITHAHELGLQWLSANFQDGVFRYELDPQFDETPESSNALRQLMASRVVASEAATSDIFQEIHTENIEYVLQEWYKEDEGGGYVFFKDKSKLGANAMLLRSIVASPDFEQYEDQARMLAEGIMALQNDDGSFVPWYVEPDYEYEADHLLNFYSGEALLALFEYYEKTNDEVVLSASQKGADFYITKYVEQIDENYHPAYVPWHTLAYSKLFTLSEDTRYVEAIYVMNDRLLDLLDTTIRPGRFYKSELEDEGQEAPHASSDAVYLEGLLYAYELARDTGEAIRAEQYREAIELSAARLVALQYQSEEVGFLADPRAYIGAIPVRENTSRIRVDTVQHTLDAFEKYLIVFEAESR